MSTDSWRDLLDERWAELEAEPVTAERRLRVTDLSIGTDDGALMAAVDYEGHRHLLVPMKSRQQLRRGPDGPVLKLRKRPLEDETSYRTYADLSCLERNLNDLFATLCSDVLDTAEQLPANPVKALYRAMDRWKSLFRVQGAPLSGERITGLFGELLVLVAMLERDPSAHRLWLGPSGHRHDFCSPHGAVEVKSSTYTEGRRARIHGLDQLEAPEGGPLHLVWFRLAASASGTSLPELVDRALELCDDETSLRGLLSHVGYQPADVERYAEARFVATEQRWYPVGKDFPRLTGRELEQAGVPVTVEDVAYTVDLTGPSLAPLSEEAVTEVLDALLREPA
ncbi:PD-(D/E)XK motif protein [Streptomyces xanthii]|uniref:PD-(D/E)XK motif protein n=1 Tax=Streptomyces xanthii TaxID=2768069 RepID=A0A7H1BB92_9ACTN|nr:PD-(D/E)XK motif protein [Streptomyces xanthii]QNS05997.1 PD-(D/E)XK motif protein [Streptomyces xanthii]